MKQILLCLSLLILSNAFSHAFEYQDADLIFQISGNSSFSNAITSATSSSDSLSFVHVAMVSNSKPESAMVIESSPEYGVREIPLDQFLDTSIKINGKPGAVVKRFQDDINAPEIIHMARSFIGQPYDWYYMPDNGMVYCSELIYESYRDREGQTLFKARPMNFRASDGSMPEFWSTLYKNLGIDVPEGIPGTNPNDMSKDPRLIEVFRYF